MYDDSFNYFDNVVQFHVK